MAGRRRHFGSVRKRSSGRWQASYFHLGQRHNAPETFTTKAEALAWLSGVEVDIHRGGWVDEKGGRKVFADVASSWLESRPDLAPRTILQYESLLKCHLLPAFGHMPIAEYQRRWSERGTPIFCQESREQLDRRTASYEPSSDRRFMTNFSSSLPAEYRTPERTVSWSERFPRSPRCRRSRRKCPKTSG